MTVGNCQERSVFITLCFSLFVLHGAAKGDSNPNVVLITIDTLRADHLGCYGDASIRTPNIDALAREGVRLTQAYTPVPITLPAHASLMTGEFPLATMKDRCTNCAKRNRPIYAC